MSSGPSTMETIFINMFLDETGVGEIWDAYQEYKNPKQFAATFVRSLGYILAGNMILVGFVFLLLYFIFGILEYISVGLIVVGCILIIILFAHHHYKHHKKVTSAPNVGAAV